MTMFKNPILRPTSWYYNNC